MLTSYPNPLARHSRVVSLVAVLACATIASITPISLSGETPVPLPAASVTAPSSAPLTEEQKQYYVGVARLAWKYFENNYRPTTGFANASPTYFKTTLWDVGGQLLATYAAKELKLISRATYDKRTTTALNTLEKLPLFHGAAYNRLYSTVDGTVGTDAKGWSATDLGRFLLTLKIVSLREPKYAAQIERIARRNDFSQIVIDGYLHGQLMRAGTPWTFQEGRIGYEQYSATGFSLWGVDVTNALDVNKNAEPVTVVGVPLLQDKRYDDRLLSEPFFLLGLEVGLQGPMKDLAVNLLKAQEERYKTTGQVTIASEDAVSVPPDYFYYYCVLCSRKPFVIGLVSSHEQQDTPRWVSTKAAFGWDAIMPSEYTKKAVALVEGSREPNGWASGVYEKTAVSTKTLDINTATALLEVALYQLRGGKPLIEDAITETVKPAPRSAAPRSSTAKPARKRTK